MEWGKRDQPRRQYESRKQEDVLDGAALDMRRAGTAEAGTDGGRDCDMMASPAMGAKRAELADMFACGRA